MANQDSFIDEVNEEVRRDRLYGLLRRYGWIAILLVVLIVGGAAWNEFRKANQRAAAESLGDAVIAALEEEQPAARLAALAEIDPGDDPDTAAFLALMRSGATLDADDRDAAVASLTELAGRGDISPVYRDLAILKSVMIAGSGIAPEDRITQLQGLSLPGAPFRLPALEQIALAEVERGETDAALALFSEILGDSASSDGLRRRAAQMIVALGGSLDDA